MNNIQELTGTEMEEATGAVDLGDVLDFAWNETKKFFESAFCSHTPGAFLRDENVKNNAGYGYYYLRYYRCSKCGSEYYTSESVAVPRV